MGSILWEDKLRAHHVQEAMNAQTKRLIPFSVWLERIPLIKVSRVNNATLATTAQWME